jgi:hypothetical protein
VRQLYGVFGQPVVLQQWPTVLLTLLSVAAIAGGPLSEDPDKRSGWTVALTQRQQAIGLPIDIATGGTPNENTLISTTLSLQS